MKIFKKLLPAIFVLFLSVPGFQASAQGIEFVHDIDSALALAQAQNKPIFIDFYTSWCAPCKVMTKEVFPEEKVGTYFNSQFINCKIQCDDNGIGVKVGEKYKINAYPTLMFLNAKGELIHSMAGGLSSEEFIDLAKIAVDPERNLSSLLTQWNDGKRDTAFVNEYFDKLKSAYRTELAKSQFEEYFNALPKKEKTTKHTFELIKLLGFAPTTPIFVFVEDNRASFNKTVGEANVSKWLKSIYTGYLRAMALTKGGAARNEYFAAKTRLKAKNFSGYDEIAMYLSVYETFDTTGKVDIKEYQNRGTAFLDKYGKENDSYAVGLTALLGNCTGRENEGAAGITWMENLLARKRDPNYLSIYFYILWRNYQFDKAIEVGEEMKANAIKQNQPYKDIDAQITMVKDLKVKKAKPKTTGS
jgi:thioredoxin-related protein